MQTPSTTFSDGVNFVSNLTNSALTGALLGSLGGFVVRLISDKTGLISASLCLNPLNSAVMWATACCISDILKKQTGKSNIVSCLPISFIMISLLTGTAITQVSIAAAAINILVVASSVIAIASVLPDK